MASYADLLQDAEAQHRVLLAWQQSFPRAVFEEHAGRQATALLKTAVRTRLSTTEIADFTERVVAGPWPMEAKATRTNCKNKLNE